MVHCDGFEVELADWGSQEILFDRRTMRDRLAASS
jgi:hypothetical protein